MSKTYCRFCEVRFIGIYLNCPKCGKWLAPMDVAPGRDMEPENCEYEMVLEDSAIGRWVWYVPNHAKDDKSQWERGKIKSFRNNDQHAFVVYNANDNWDGDHWMDYTAASTRYDDLRFAI